MERLVYRPKVWAYVKTDRQALDLTPYIVSGSVNRVVNDVSTASLTLRNPDFKFTEPGAPMFHPMDPITIYMARNINRPVRVFTGFLDSTPYLQLFPGTVTLEASCTLKKLKYTYWDPALPFSKYFIGQYGWQQYRSDGTSVNLKEIQPRTSRRGSPALTDGGFQNILFGVLEAVGGWREEDIFIEELPAGIVDTVTKIVTAFKNEGKETEEAIREFLKEAIGETAAGAAAAADGGTTDGPTSGRYHKKGTRLQKGVTYTVGASTYGWTASDDTGVDVVDKSLFSGKPAVAELGGAFNMSISGAGPDYNQEVQVCYKGRCTTAYFRDVGTGGADVKGRPRAIDLHERVAKAIGFPNGVDLVQITLPEGVNEANSGRSGSRAAPPPSRRNDPRTNSDSRSKVGPRPLTASASINDITGGSDLVNAATDVIEQNVPAPRSGNRTVVARSAVSLQDDLPGALPTPPTPGQSGKGPTPARPRNTTKDDKKKPLWPVPTGYKAGNPFGAPRPGRTHEGLDFPVPEGTDIFAVLDGEVTIVNSQSGGYGEWIELKHDGNIYTRYAHLRKGGIKVRVGQKVKKGDVIAKSGNTGSSTGPHLHFEYRPGGVPADPAPWLNGADSQASGSEPTGAAGAAGGGVSRESAQGIATASAFATTLELPSAQETLEAQAFMGAKSYINDKPLMEFVEQLCTASMRHFMSLPDGRFYAFFPDHFGTFRPDRGPYWEIDDIELIEGYMELSDEELKTHVYVVGDTNFNMEIDLVDKTTTAGVVTIFNAFETNWLLSQTGGKGKKALFKDTTGFLARYGVRPDYHPEPIIRSKFFEAFAGFQRFMFLWSRQFLTQFEFTFMPELFPGGRVAFKDHDLVCYVDSVQHQFDYTNGFQTFAQLSAPSAADTNDDGMMEKFTYGMVKSFGT